MHCERGARGVGGVGRALMTPAGPTCRPVGPPWSGRGDVRLRTQLGSPAGVMPSPCLWRRRRLDGFCQLTRQLVCPAAAQKEDQHLRPTRGEL